MRITLTDKTAFLITERWRFKVLHGGRGGGKSHAVARALVYLVARRRLRVLCTREVQKSLRESVHQLLSDVVSSLGLDSEFDVLEAEIRHRDGGVFVFSGLSTQTADSLKSYEGVDIVWVEEAHSVTKKSWQILVPTIRKEGSEIWVTFNPALQEDETYRRFVMQTPPRSKVVQINYPDNPWFSAELEESRAHDERTLTAELYRNIWLGEPIEISDGAIYANELKHLRRVNRIGQVPIVPHRAINTFWDLGTSVGNATAIWMHQRVGLADRFIKFVGGTGEGMEHWWRKAHAWKLDNAPPGTPWGVHHLPHDGANRLQARQLVTRRDILQDLINETPGARSQVVVVPRVDDLSVAIDLTRRRLLDAYFDEAGCSEGLAALKRYRYEWMEAEKRFSRTPLHNDASNPADAFRTWATGYKPEGPPPDSGIINAPPSSYVRGAY